MKLIFAVVHDKDVDKIINAFNKNNLSITKVCSTGGFLKSGNTTLIAGLEDDKLQRAIDIIENNSEGRRETIRYSAHKGKVSDSGEDNLEKISLAKATIFITEVERYIKF